MKYFPPEKRRSPAPLPSDKGSAGRGSMSHTRTGPGRRWSTGGTPSPPTTEAPAVGATDKVLKANGQIGGFRFKEEPEAYL